jgi:hypothetical protein
LSRQVEKFRVNFAKLSGLEELDLAADVDHPTPNLKRKLNWKSNLSFNNMKTIAELRGNGLVQNKKKRSIVVMFSDKQVDIAETN